MAIENEKSPEKDAKKNKQEDTNAKREKSAKNDQQQKISVPSPATDKASSPKKIKSVGSLDDGQDANQEPNDKDMEPVREQAIAITDKTDEGNVDIKIDTEKKAPESKKIVTFYTTQDKNDTAILKEQGFTFTKKLGKGAFAVVNLVKRLATNEDVAVKVMDISKDKKKRLAEIKNEIYALEQVAHDHVIKLFQSFIIDDKVYIFMEYGEGGDLSAFVRRKGPLTERRSRNWFNQMAKAINHMHVRGIAHRDLKLQNVLLTKRGKAKAEIKIADFGLSRVSYKKHEGVIYCKSYSGTLLYMAPEILETDADGHRYYNPLPADIWALGVCLFVMLNRAYPFPYDDDGKILQRQKRRQFEYRDNIRKKPLTSDVKNLLENFLEPDAQKRIAFYGIFNHRWTQLKGSTNTTEDDRANSPNAIQPIDATNQTSPDTGQNKSPTATQLPGPTTAEQAKPTSGQNKAKP